MANAMLQGSYFIESTTFNLAHWMFAFSYLVVSYRIELSICDLPKKTFGYRLSFFNFTFCLLNVAIPALYWLYYSKDEYKLVGIFNDVD